MIKRPRESATQKKNEPPLKKRKVVGKYDKFDRYRNDIWENATYQEVLKKIDHEKAVSPFIELLVGESEKIESNFKSSAKDGEEGYRRLDDPDRLITPYPPGRRTSSKTGLSTDIRADSKLRYGNTKGKFKRNSNILTTPVMNSCNFEAVLSTVSSEGEQNLDDDGEVIPKPPSHDPPEPKNQHVIYQDHMVNSMNNFIENEIDMKSFETNVIDGIQRVVAPVNGIRENIFDFIKLIHLTHSSEKAVDGKDDTEKFVRWWDEETGEYKEEKADFPIGFVPEFDLSENNSHPPSRSSLLLRKFETEQLLRTPLKSQSERHCVNGEYCAGNQLPVIHPATLREFVTMAEWIKYQEKKVWDLPIKRRPCLLCLRLQINVNWWVNAAMNLTHFDASEHTINMIYNIVLKEGEYMPHSCLSNDFGFQGQFGPVVIYNVRHYQTVSEKSAKFGERVIRFVQQGIPVCQSSCDDVLQASNSSTEQKQDF